MSGDQRTRFPEELKNISQIEQFHSGLLKGNNYAIIEDTMVNTIPKRKYFGKGLEPLHYFINDITPNYRIFQQGKSFIKL